MNEKKRVFEKLFKTKKLELSMLSDADKEYHKRYSLWVNAKKRLDELAMDFGLISSGFNMAISNYKKIESQAKELGVDVNLPLLKSAISIQSLAESAKNKLKSI